MTQPSFASLTECLEGRIMLPLEMRADSAHSCILGRMAWQELCNTPFFWSAVPAASVCTRVWGSGKHGSALEGRAGSQARWHCRPCPAMLTAVCWVCPGHRAAEAHGLPPGTCGLWVPVQVPQRAADHPHLRLPPAGAPRHLRSRQAQVSAAGTWSTHAGQCYLWVQKALWNIQNGFQMWGSSHWRI